METLGLTRAFWKDRRVFVTGHTGFKGGWLTLWLQQLGALVTGYSLVPSTTPCLFAAATVESGIQSIIGDIRDGDALASALLKAEPEIVLHLAAQPLVRDSYLDPIGTYATNVMGTVHLLSALRKIPSCRNVLIVTSDKSYENREWEYPYRETDALGGHDPYSSSKACTELVTQAFRLSYFAQGNHDSGQVCVGSARAGNVIGGGDWAKDRIMTDTIAALGNGVEIVVRNPKAVRPWQHVLEPVFGYLRWAELSFDQNARWASAWNFGPGASSTRPVSWIVGRACELWGGTSSWRIDSSSHPHEATLLRLDSSKAERFLAWQGRLSVDEALEWTINWYKAFNKGSDMRQLTLSQIECYEALVDSREAASQQK